MSARATSYREALREAHREALRRDPRVFVMGEDVGKYGGSYAVTKGFFDEFGPERIRDTPLSELAFVGTSIGAALGGLRPIVEIMTVNFSLLALDQIVNTAATLRHMSGGQFSVPVVIRMATGAGRWLRSIRTAWRSGTRTYPASACWLPRRSRTRAACCGRPSRIRIRS
jgi:pyruvate dehydrogenase E1 component beta subunit